MRFFSFSPFSTPWNHIKSPHTKMHLVFQFNSHIEMNKSAYFSDLSWHLVNAYTDHHHSKFMYLNVSCIYLTRHKISGESEWAEIKDVRCESHTQTHSHKQWCLGLEQWAIRVGKHEVVSNNSNCWGSQIHRPMKMAFPTNVYRKCTVQNVLKLFQKWQQMWKSYIEMARNKCITLTWHWWIEWVNEPESRLCVVEFHMNQHTHELGNFHVIVTGRRLQSFTVSAIRMVQRHDLPVRKMLCMYSNELFNSRFSQLFLRFCCCCCCWLFFYCKWLLLLLFNFCHHFK